ncbi:MAG: hypothetical protein U5K36_16880 [Roseovarius sp.]|nr:hypothetical protein [Roseovarius sp.]
MPKKPHAGTELAKYIERRIVELKPKKTQAEIAAQAGFVNLPKAGSLWMLRVLLHV